MKNILLFAPLALYLNIPTFTIPEPVGLIVVGISLFGLASMFRKRLHR